MLLVISSFSFTVNNFYGWMLYFCPCSSLKHIETSSRLAIVSFRMPSTPSIKNKQTKKAAKKLNESEGLKCGNCKLSLCITNILNVCVCSNGTPVFLLSHRSVRKLCVALLPLTQLYIFKCFKYPKMFDCHYLTPWIYLHTSAQFFC